MRSLTFLRRPSKPRFYIRRIVGASMQPALPPGRIVVAIRRRRLPRIGEVVIVRHEGHDIIKRVHAVSGTRLFVVGDNPDLSTDSRAFGWLPLAAVCGIVHWPRRIARTKLTAL